MTKPLPPGWRRVRLGEVLEQVNRFEQVHPANEYRLLGVKWYAEGVFERERKLGKAIAAKQLNRVEEGDFIYNRLLAWKGSFAVVGNGHAGGHVSGEFPVFRAKPGLILAEFLYRYFSRPNVWNWNDVLHPRRQNRTDFLVHAVASIVSGHDPEIIEQLGVKDLLLATGFTGDDGNRSPRLPLLRDSTLASNATVIRPTMQRVVYSWTMRLNYQ